MKNVVHSDINTAFQEAQTLMSDLGSNIQFHEVITRAAEMVYVSLTSGNTLYTAGNGGSAAEAQHFAGEFTGRFRRDRPSFPAVALTAESSTVTAIANDYAYEEIFARQLQAFGKAGDVFIPLTTSGNSPNILKALAVAREKGMTTIALLGKGGGLARGIADLDIIVPSQSTARIQEVHLLIIHAICEYFDTNLLDVR